MRMTYYYKENKAYKIVDGDLLEELDINKYSFIGKLEIDSINNVISGDVKEYIKVDTKEQTNIEKTDDIE